MKSRILLYSLIPICSLIAFAIGSTPHEADHQKMGWVVIEYRGELNVISVHHDQIVYDQDEQKWCVQLDNRWRFYMPTDIPVDADIKRF